MKITVNHKLDKNEAFRRIKSLLAELKEEHGDKVADIKEEWGDYAGELSWKISGFKINARFRVENDRVVVTGKLPLAAIPFRSMVENTIREEASKLLD